MSTSKGPLKYGKTGTLALEAGLDDEEIAGISGGVTHHATPAHNASMVAASHASMAAHQAATDAALQQHDAAQATPHVDAAVQGAIGVAVPHQDAAQTVSHVEAMTPAAKGAIGAALLQHDAAQAAPQIHEMTPAAQGAIHAAIKLNDAGHAGATFASALDPLVEASPQKGVLVNSLKDIHGTEVSGDAGKSASNFLGGAALDGALLQSYYKAPTDSAGAHTEKDATHVLATAGAGVTNTVDLGHGVNLVSQANASATTEAHVGPLGVGANVVLNAKVSETLNLTEHADISVVAKATGDVHAKASVITGVGATADGGVNAEASLNQHEKGSLGGGVDGMQQTTLAAGLDAHATGGANVGLNGVSGGVGAFAGAYAKVGETAGIEGGGVKASGSVEVYSPGVVGINQSGTFDVHDGKLNIAFSIGGAFGIGGLSIGGNVSINTAPLVDAGKAVGDFFGGVFGGGSPPITAPTPQQNQLAAEYRHAYEQVQQHTDQIMHGYEHHGKHSAPPTHAELQKMHNQALAAAEKVLNFDAITAKFAKEYNAAGTMGVTNGADQAGAIRMFADMDQAKVTGHETVKTDAVTGIHYSSNDSVWAGPSR